MAEISAHVDKDWWYMRSEDDREDNSGLLSAFVPDAEDFGKESLVHICHRAGSRGVVTTSGSLKGFIGRVVVDTERDETETIEYDDIFAYKFTSP